MKDELLHYKIRSKIKKIKGKLIAFQINFPKTRIDNIQYIISLPKNSVELKLNLTIKGRKNKKSLLDEKKAPFMGDISPEEILKLQVEDLILDVIAHYRDFNFDAFTNPG